MFSKSVKTMKTIVNIPTFESMQVEGVNGKMCQRNINKYERYHSKSMEKQCWIYARQVMLKLLEQCQKSKPKGSQQIKTCTQPCIKKEGQKHMSNKCRNTCQNLECLAPKSSLTLFLSLRSRLSRQRKPWTVPAQFP